ncbi:VWA domain-containing protein [uncultured Paludibaculum sp.]|uniref:VWA domain-containing protein n=1 Tax=uncultured Paludibaculum sp. TaxID=1765020 RepID=UPI002AAB7381|nr:VWA domain-containing protein [uncultured Paludibaculum sp.]
MSAKHVGLILCTFLLFLWIFPAAALQQDPVFTTTTRLVEVTTIVSDSKGQPVTGLTKDDFTVLENGKPQTITQLVTEDSLRQAARPLRLPPNVFTNRLEALPRTQRSVIVLVLDYLNTPWNSQTATREQVLSVLRKLKGDDIVAIYTMGQTLQLLHDFTSDHALLAARLAKAPGLLTPLSKSPNEIVSLDSQRWSEAFGESRFAAERFYTSTMERTRTLLTMQTLSLIARHMAGFPGRKNLVWLSTGFPITILSLEHTTPKVIMSSTEGYRVDNMPKPSEIVGGSGAATLFMDSMNRAIDTINAAGVSVYGVDVSGLIVPFDEASVGAGYRISNSELGSTAINIDNQTSLITFAEKTGGAALAGANDVEGILGQAISDGRNYYLIAYHTSNPKMDGKYRKIEIKVNRPGMKVRHRPGYTAFEPSKDATPELKGDLDEAGVSPVTQSAILLTAQVVPGENKNINVAVQIDTSRISFRQEKDSWVGYLDLVFYQKSADGKMAGSKANMPLKLTAEQYATAMKKGILYRQSVELKPGASVLRIGVRDSGSGLVGTLDIPLNRS